MASMRRAVRMSWAVLLGWRSGANRPKKNDGGEVYWECTRCEHMKAFPPVDPMEFGSGSGFGS